MSKTLEGQVALITGGGSGIGAEIARSLANAGAFVVLAGRRKGKLEEVARTLAAESLCVVCDAREEVSIEAAVEAARAAKGRLDMLVNNAGIFDMKPIEETTVEFWDEVHATNLRGAFLFARSAWPHLRASQGQLVNISSIAGTRGFSGGAAYCASKFGMNGLSEVLRIEGKPHGIRVFSVCPGSVETPLWEPLSTDEERDRMMKPETIADFVRWLLESPRGIEVEGVVVNNFRNPFQQ